MKGTGEQCASPGWRKKGDRFPDRFRVGVINGSWRRNVSQGQSNWKQMHAATQMNECYGKRIMKPSSKLKKLSSIHEEVDSETTVPTNKLASGAHRNLHFFQMKRTVRRNILKTKRIESFQNRSPSILQWKEFTKANSKSTTGSGYTEYTETTSELSITTEALPYLLPLSLDSELLVDDDSSTTADSCSSIEIFREAEDHTSVGNQDDISWFNCKNSTLLDSSKAANIDVIGQPSGLSEILEKTENPIAEGIFKRDHVSDGTKVHENSQTVPFTVAGKRVSKLHANKDTTLEQKSVHAVSLPLEQKKLMNEEPSSRQVIKCKKKVNFAEPVKIEYTSEISRIKPLNIQLPFQLEKQILVAESKAFGEPIQTSTPVETFKQSTRLKQDEVPICSIILAPVCSRPSKIWQCEHVQPWPTFENIPIDIIIDL